MAEPRDDADRRHAAAAEEPPTAEELLAPAEPPFRDKSFLKLLGAGLFLAILVSVANVFIAFGFLEPWLEDKFAAQGHNGEKWFITFALMSQMLFYPALQVLMLGLILPAFAWFNPWAIRQERTAIAMVAWPTLVT